MIDSLSGTPQGVLSQISVMNNIGLSMTLNFRYQTKEGKVRNYVGYRIKLLPISDIPGSLNDQVYFHVLVRFHNKSLSIFKFKQHENNHKHKHGHGRQYDIDMDKDMDLDRDSDIDTDTFGENLKC